MARAPAAASQQEGDPASVLAARRMAVVDLTRGSVGSRPIPLAWRQRVLGGRGLNVLLLLRYLPAGTEPFDPANVMVLGAGLLTGTPAPSSSRMNVTFKSPETGILGDGSLGGGFGAALRQAGFDHVVVRGRAPRPTMLLVEDGRVELRDASALWGRDTLDGQAALRAELGQDVEALVCGVAGERLARFASVRSGVKRSARCGGGAVMGSKLLKAIVARGTGEPLPAADPEGLRARGGALHGEVRGSPMGNVLGSVGTAHLHDTADALGIVRVRNAQANVAGPGVGSEAIEARLTSPSPCAGCSVHCTHRNVHGGEGPEYGTTGNLGPNLGITDPDDVIRLSNLCNDLGFDTSSAGGYLAWAFELFQRGVITEALTGEPLRWGDADLAARLLRKASRREGFGNVLAEGSRAVALGYYPAEALDWFVGVKGLPQSDPHDVRYLKGFGLGLAVASRGADHLRNRPTLELATSLPRARREAIYGPGASTDPTSYEGKAQGVAFSEDMFAVVDSVGICKFVTRGFNSPDLMGLEHVRDLLRLTTGLDLDEAELRQRGAEVVDMERWFNHREAGLTRAHDTLPRRYFDDVLQAGIAAGHRMDRAGFQRMLGDYYRLRGWREDGTLPPERVDALEALLARDA